jgi:hypothetical protein
MHFSAAWQSAKKLTLRAEEPTRRGCENLFSTSLRTSAAEADFDVDGSTARLNVMPFPIFVLCRLFPRSMLMPQVITPKGRSLKPPPFKSKIKSPKPV